MNQIITPVLFAFLPASAAEPVFEAVAALRLVGHAGVVGHLPTHNIALFIAGFAQDLQGKLEYLDVHPRVNRITIALLALGAVLGILRGINYYRFIFLPICIVPTLHWWLVLIGADRSRS